MKKKKSTASISTFLGTDASIQGIIEFKDTIRLDGQVKGKVFSRTGTVIIGEKAIIDAEIIVDVAIIMGRVNGTIEARQRIEVYPPGHIVGDIQAPTILIESGVVFYGNCTMKPTAASPQKLPEPAVSAKNPAETNDLRATEKF